MWTWYQKLGWSLFRRLVGPRLQKKYQLTPTEKNPVPEPPYILMANHSHAQDPYMIAGLSTHKIHYMANIDGVSRFQQSLSKITGAYAKAKGRSDTAAVRRTFDIIKSGEVVGIFPEGDRSWDGCLAELPSSAALLVYKLKVPLRLIRLRGNYLSGPRWGEKRGRGHVLLEAETLSVEEIREMGPKALQQRIIETLTVNDIKDPDLKSFAYDEKPAEGIQRLLWKCPVCGAEDEIYGKKDLILCDGCGKHWKLDPWLAYLPKNPAGSDLKDWYDWQKAEIQRMISAGEVQFSTPGVRLYRRKGQDQTLMGEGTLWSDGTRVELRAGEICLFGFDRSEISEQIDNFNAYVEFTYGKERYRLFFGGKNALKWLQLFDN